MMNFVLLAAFLTISSQPLGPGSGKWEVVSPESQGLSRDKLERAARESDASVGSRNCYLVVKNGRIVHEQYYRGWSESSTMQAWSCTKSFCASLFGVAVEQGWADVNFRVSDYSQTRQCNNDATYQNVLTMTGTSNDINNPQFSYDTTGDLCLDTLSDFIDGNNEQQMSGNQWRDRFYRDVMGFEHDMRWSSLLFNSNSFRCGFGVESSCRDLARAAQLWANEGEWAGHGQVASRDYIRKGRTWVYPNSGTEYGYTVWLDVHDNVDPEVHHFNGMFSQCAFVSKEHEAVIVSMGQGEITGDGCGRVWEHSKHAIVHHDHPSFNATSAPTPSTPSIEFPISPQEIRQVMEYYLEHEPEKLTSKQVESYKEFLIEYFPEA